MPDRDTQRRILLAAAIAALLEEEEGTGAHDASPRAWSRTGHPHLASWGWNPRSGGAGWRLAARVSQHRDRTPGGA